MSDSTDSNLMSKETFALLQDIFILLALQAGMNVESVRQHLRVDKKRINKISTKINLKRKIS